MDNNIVQKLDYGCKVNVIPNILYPTGGLINLDSYFPSKITKSINVTLNGIVNSDKPVSIKGTEKLNVILYADNLWKHTFYSAEEKSFTLQGTKNVVINHEYDFDPKECYDFIAKVEQGTDMRAGKYTLKIIPLITGTITYQEKNIPLSISNELNFEVTNGRTTLVGVRTFSSSTPYQTTIKLQQNQKLFANLVPVSYVKNISLSVSLLSFLILMLLVIYNKFIFKSTVNDNNNTEVYDIDKKYKTRLVFVNGDINSTKPNLKVDEFKTLLRLADEKEISILKVSDSRSGIIYCIIDENCMYSYQIYSNEKAEFIK